MIMSRRINLFPHTSLFELTNYFRSSGSKTSLHPSKVMNDFRFVSSLKFPYLEFNFGLRFRAHLVYKACSFRR